jgi:phage baseplate assembly protein W
MPAAQISNYQLSLTGATWVDVNSQFTVNNLPDRLPDVLAINNSIYNILNCPIGARSRIFQPEYGSLWYQFLQEPLDQTTANKMQVAMIQALGRWEPRITIDNSNSYVTPNLSLPGYQVRIAFSLNLNLSANNSASVSFSVSTSQS